MSDKIKKPEFNKAATPAHGPSSTFGNWEEQKRKLKVKFPILTDANLEFRTGKKDEMLISLQKKLNKTPSELNAVISGL